MSSRAVDRVAGGTSTERRNEAEARPDAVLRAVATPRRREILRLLWREERSAGEVRRAFPDVTFGAVSQHLRVLREAGLVARRRVGREQRYRVRREALGPLQSMLESMWDSALHRLRVQAELEQARRGPRRQDRKQESAPRAANRRRRPRR